MTISPATYRIARVILFDLDGTLVDSLVDIAASLNHVLVNDGLEPFRKDEVRPLVGDGAGALVRQAFALRGKDHPVDGLTRFREHYGEHCLDTTKAYAGMPALLKRLRAAQPQRHVAVVTNKPTAFAERIVE